MESIIQQAIEHWSLERGIQASSLRNIKVRWSEPQIGFHSISFNSPNGLVILKIIEGETCLKLIELS